MGAISTGGLEALSWLRYIACAGGCVKYGSARALQMTKSPLRNPGSDGCISAVGRRESWCQQATMFNHLYSSGRARCQEQPSVEGWTVGHASVMPIVMPKGHEFLPSRAIAYKIILQKSAAKKMPESMQTMIERFSIKVHRGARMQQRPCDSTRSCQSCSLQG